MALKTNPQPVVSLARNALSGHRNWTQAWRSPPPQRPYDAIIVGGTGRDTTIVRCNYYLPEYAHFHEFSLKLWEGVSRELGYNVMFSQRGILQLAHSPGELEGLVRCGNATRCNSIDAELLDHGQVADKIPFLDTAADTRYPVAGELQQARRRERISGFVRHDLARRPLAACSTGMIADGPIRPGPMPLPVGTSNGPTSARRQDFGTVGKCRNKCGKRPVEFASTFLPRFGDRHHR